MINENLYYQIELTARRIRKYGQAVLNDHHIDITIEQWLVLKVIADNNGINQLQIGEILFKDKPTISKMVKTLDKKELIIKEPSSIDSRQVEIKLSAKGKKWIEDFFPLIEKIRLKGLENLSQNEKKVTSSTLAKIRKNFSD